MKILSTNPRAIAARKWFSKPENKAKWNKLHVARRQRLKAEIFNLFGNKCAKCKFSDKRALQIDHVNGQGSNHRKIISWSAFYMQLAKGIDIEKYQLLCANCNWIKRYENDEWKGKVMQ